MNNYKNEYNSLRAMATNLHTLHSSIGKNDTNTNVITILILMVIF